MRCLRHTVRRSRPSRSARSSGLGSCETRLVPGDDRRRFKRLAQQLRVQLHLVDPDEGGRTITALGTHLSPTGIFVQLADPPPVGTQVTVTVGAEGTADLRPTTWHAPLNSASRTVPVTACCTFATKASSASRAGENHRPFSTRSAYRTARSEAIRVQSSGVTSA